MTESMALRLRRAPLPVADRVRDDRLLLDVRTVFRSEHGELLASMESPELCQPPDGSG